MSIVEPRRRRAAGWRLALLAIGLLLGLPGARAETLSYGWQEADGVKLFYREAGPRDAPTIVFLHGTPASSRMYQPLMERLADSHTLHVLAVDYPSYGFSDAPDRAAYAYTFDHLAATVRQFLKARGIARYALYMQDYGVPVGFRLISADPGAVTAVMVQNTGRQLGFRPWPAA
jgi:pimeloyl-ACP methyl ester carboxylesterase